MKKTIAILALAASAISLSPAFAEDEYNISTGLTAANAPLGFHGVDPVAFVDLDNRIEGDAQFTAVHDGVAYYFASRANMNKFRKSPADYLPQNGGFCTFGVSVAKKFDGDPQYSDVRNGKLYVFLNEEIFRSYQKDPDGVIAKAAENWKQIRSIKATEL